MIKNFRIFAHRGASGYEPENTIRSFNKALDLGAEWIELDVQNVGGVMVAFHDDRLERLTGHSGRVDRLLVSDLGNIRIKGNEPLPRLDSILALAANKAGLNIEIKGRQTAKLLADILGKALKEGWRPEKLLVSSFDHVQLKEFSDLCPQVPIGVLVYGDQPDLVERCKFLKANSIHLSLSFLKAAVVQTLKDSGFSVYVYTVNHEDDLEYVLETGANGAFSDYPDRLMNWLKQRSTQER